MKRSLWLVVLTSLAVLAGCASWLPTTGAKQVASTVDYLYPNAKEAPQMKAGVTTLRPPIRVGIAFVPGGGMRDGLPEADKLKLLERVKAAFAKYPFIGGIEVIPTTYLQPKGGFTNLEQVARMFDVEVMALLSYDQVQFNDSNALSVLYWTIIGAYVIHGDQYDIQTLVDASVFDVQSRKLLFRAPGTSQIKGSASMAGFSEQSRGARLAGYNQAIDEMIPRLQAELDGFKERVKSDQAYRVENRPGYSGGGSVDWIVLALGLAAVGIGYATRRAR